ncbi:MAG: adenylyl-sulfate kinase [Candidatus Marinimicrobia bacterium]|nr:adenylyl-sulfate kinase [Candidatus Neomarinimicrobiota bacterium]
MRSSNIRWQDGDIDREKRKVLLNQKSACLWFTGLSGSGKSTLARSVEKALYEMDRISYVLDGDNVRHGLNGDLGFSDEDRKENIRRIGEVSKLFVDAGLLTLTAFISPFRTDRKAVRNMLEQGQFIEIYVNCPLDICEQRDVKGLYARARKNEISTFTGISSPYEAPENPEIRVNTGEQNLEESTKIIINYLKENHIIETK